MSPVRTQNHFTIFISHFTVIDHLSFINFTAVHKCNFLNVKLLLNINCKMLNASGRGWR